MISSFPYLLTEIADKMFMKYLVKSLEQNGIEYLSWKGPTSIIQPNWLTNSGLTKS